MTTILRLATGPSVEPVSLVEAKAYLREDGSDQDAVLALLIQAARQYVETATDRALVSQAWTATLPEWPRAFMALDDDEAMVSPVIPSSVQSGSVEIVKLPIISIGSATLAGAAWTGFTTLRTARGFRITPAGTVESGEIVINFTAGFGTTATDVPADLRLAILKLIATCYDQTGASSFDMAGVSAKAESLPGFADTLHRYRVMA